MKIAVMFTRLGGDKDGAMAAVVIGQTKAPVKMAISRRDGAARGSVRFENEDDARSLVAGLGAVPGVNAKMHRCYHEEGMRCVVLDEKDVEVGLA